MLSCLTYVACEDLNQADDCATDIVCTQQFEIHTYTLLDSIDQPIILDNYYSQNLENGNIYDFDAELTDFLAANEYLIITDAQMNELKRSGTRIRFFGEKNGEIIVQEDFLVGHNCCHIEVFEGPNLDWIL